MDRRSVLTGAAGLAVGAATFAKPAIAQGKRELKMVTTWPKNFPGLGTGAQRFADRITKASDGKLTVKVFAAGELVPAFESFDAVSQGTADMYHGADYYWKGKSQAYNFFASVPFGLTANEMDAWIHHSGGQELWDELGSQFGIKHLLCGNTGVQWGGWFTKEINSLEDMKGLKMRMPGLGGDVLNKIGANALALPGGEIYPALQSGAIDATEWVGPWNDLAFGFYKVAKYYYYPGFHEPGSSLGVGINSKVWEGFSESEKALVQDAATAENNYLYAEFNARNGAALETLVTKHGVQIKKTADDILNAMGEASGQVMADVANTDKITRKVYDSFVSFRKNAIAMGKYADEAYAKARRLPFKYGG
ncbi:TRAP transporter substrate-binding protein [Sneathiella chinensis]|uniref:C4-dicarboxylate ABC transporter n=1 Tax=Sneathiella chinensis TaxID=349750 RepID=A0ABQ5U3P8_9PROT|nr:TRAP transporter substrate-binding protein [Sneathiella chinensis]GLQ06443.1 C4-dicarboxylate ABC transporter [Sneathiella chinensis]